LTGVVRFLKTKIKLAYFRGFGLVFTRKN